MCNWSRIGYSTQAFYTLAVKNSLKMVTILYYRLVIQITAAAPWFQHKSTVFDIKLLKTNQKNKKSITIQQIIEPDLSDK